MALLRRKLVETELKDLRPKIRGPSFGASVLLAAVALVASVAPALLAAIL